MRRAGDVCFSEVFREGKSELISSPLKTNVFRIQR